MTIFGYMFISCIHFMISMSIWLHNGHLVLFFMVMLRISFQSIVGPVFWMYLTETLNDQQFGTVATVHYSHGALISVTVEFISRALLPQGLFALLGCFSIAFTIFLVKFFEETRDLTDR